MSIDPVCGKPVEERGAESFDYRRRRYFFCSHRCRGRFERQAERIHLGELARMGSLFADQKPRWGLA
jgi:YHS domain-containing protein